MSCGKRLYVQSLLTFNTLIVQNILKVDKFQQLIDQMFIKCDCYYDRFKQLL